MSDIEIKINGFSISKDMTMFLDENMQKLKNKSPSGSFLALVLSAVNSHYQGQLTVNSHEHSFKAENKDSSAVSVVLNLLAEIETQVKRWRRLRFSLEPYQEKT